MKITKKHYFFTVLAVGLIGLIIHHFFADQLLSLHPKVPDYAFGISIGMIAGSTYTLVKNFR